MDIKKLYSMQSVLDQNILELHNLVGANLLEEKILALLVEVGELANEVKCFKYWSLKPSSPRDVVLEEYVDGLHFILSIGISLNYEAEINIKKTENEIDKKEMTNLFNQFYQTIIEFRNDKTFVNFNKLFNDFISIGNALNFSEKDVFNAYVDKNKVNHERQENKY